MTPEAQRIAIAEACGWVRHGDEGIYGCWDDPKGFTRDNCPDYLSDLNAAHEAEEVLTENQWEIYIAHVKEIVGQEAWPTDPGYYIHATAAQRAEAFLRTLNLWKD